MHLAKKSVTTLDSTERWRGRGSLVVKVMDSWPPASREFKPSTAEDPLCRGGHWTLNIWKLKRPPFGVVGKLGEGITVYMSSSLLNSGSKMRGPSPKALVWLKCVTLIFTHSLSHRRWQQMRLPVLKRNGNRESPAVHPGRKPWRWPGASHLPTTRGLVARRLFRVPSGRKGTIHLQTSMSSPGFEPSPYSTVVRVANRYTGWETDNCVAAIRHISHSCLDPNDFTVVNCIVKGHASLSPPSLRLRLCSRFTLLTTYTYFDPKDFSPHPSTVSKVTRPFHPCSTKSKEKNKTKKKHRFTK
ncbi:hypothetical protein TNCV_183991 [Trichonephila clavipes]|nr:hypothetical protein TNCV_183991 [Trichonephila clavipes]